MTIERTMRVQTWLFPFGGHDRKKVTAVLVKF